MNIVKQKRGGNWQDEAGNAVPFKSIKKYEQVNENVTYDIAKRAASVNASLTALKQFITQQVQKAVDAFHKEYKGSRKEFKGNYTLFNFNHTIKVEISVSKPIKFDDLLIATAKDLLKEFLNQGISAKHSAVKQLVLDAFETSRGKMDVKKILSLKRYTERINDPQYTRAMKLIDQAIRRPDTAIYYRVALKSDSNRWDYLALSLADIK